MLKWRACAYWALMIFLLAVLHAPAFPEGFFSVDDDRLVRIPQLEVMSLASVRAIWTFGHHIDFYPVRDMTYAIDWLLSRDLESNAFVARAQNLFWFLGCAFFLFLLVRRFFGEMWAMVLTAIWMVHPFHFEMITWVSARKDVLALFGGLVASYYLIVAVQSSRSTFFFVAFGGFLFSILSKASLVLAPAAVLTALALGARPLLREKPKLTLTLAAMSITGLASILLQKYHYAHVTDVSFDYEFSYRVGAAAASLGRMFWGLFDARVNAIEAAFGGDWLELNRNFLWMGCLVWFVGIAAAVEALRRRHIAGLILVALWWGIYLCVPGPNPFHRSFYSVRYLEPMMLVLFVAIPFWLRPRSTRLVLSAGLMVFLLTSTAAVAMRSRWESNLAIAQQTLEASPKNPSSHHLYLIEALAEARWGRLGSTDLELARQSWRWLQVACDPLVAWDFRNGHLCMSFWRDLALLKPFADQMREPTSVSVEASIEAYRRAESAGRPGFAGLELPWRLGQASRFSKRALDNKEPRTFEATPELRLRRLFHLCYQGHAEEFRRDLQMEIGAARLNERLVAEAIMTVSEIEDRQMLQACWRPKASPSGQPSGL